MLERLKDMYQIALTNGRTEDGKVITELTRKEMAERLEVKPMTVNYLVKWIDKNELPKIEFKRAARGRSSVNREKLLEEIRKSLNLM